MEDSIPTPRLLEEEKRTADERRELVSKTALAVESVLLSADLTMGEWAEVADLINARSIKYFSTIKIKTIKENYERT